MSGEGTYVLTIFRVVLCLGVCWVGLSGAGCAGGSYSRDVCKGGARSGQVLRPQTCWCVQNVFLGGTWATCCLCCAFCEQRNCCDPSWELARASG